MPSDLRNVKGGGLHYVADFESYETKIFRAGLKHYSAHEERLITGSRRSPNHDYHDHIDYERGAIIHSRSPHNQYFNFHFMYGGFKRYFIDRQVMGNLYRNKARIMWMPIAFFFVFTACASTIMLPTTSSTSQIDGNNIDRPNQPSYMYPIPTNMNQHIKYLCADLPINQDLSIYSKSNSTLCTL